MAVDYATRADHLVETQLDRHLADISKSFERDALAIYSPLHDGLDDAVRESIERSRLRRGSRKGLVVVLTTGGGIIEIVQRIVETMRHHYEEVVFVIPNYAYSAGTVMALSGDAIYMDYYSRLGPIDPQVMGLDGRMVPANGYLVQWKRLIDKATAGQLSAPELQLMIAGFDQAALYQYEQATELSVALLKRWLVAYKFKDWLVTEGRQLEVTSKMREERAEEIARQLSDSSIWHSHGHGISRDVLQSELNIKIDDLGSYPRHHRLIRRYHSLLGDYMRRIGAYSTVHASGDLKIDRA